MLRKSADFATRISGQPMGNSLARRVADRKSGTRRGITLATGGEIKGKETYPNTTPLVAPAPTNTAVSSKGSVPVNPKSVMRERNQAQVDSLQKKEYLKTYLKDIGTGTTTKPETVTRAKYKVSSERKEVPVDRPVVNLEGTVTSRTAPKAKREKQLTQEEKEENARLAGKIGGVKRASSQETYEESYPKRTIDDVINDNIRKKVETKQGVVDAETQRLRDKYSGDGIPLITPAVNYTANRLIDKGFGENEIRGTLSAATLAPIAAGLAYNQHRKTKEEEHEKQAQAQSHRDRVAEVIAKRNLLLEQRQSQGQQPTQPRVPYNFFSAPAPLVTPANFAFPKIGVRNPFFIKKEKALPLAAVGGTLVAGYGLLSKLNKQRALDAYKVNSLKDKNAQDFAANYFDSPQYHTDNLIREAANITGNPLLQSITDNPLDRLTLAQQQAKAKGTARYSRSRTNTANFFDPFITPALALGSTAYGIYNKKKAADEQSEVFEAQKLAALDSIKDKQLRRGLLNKAQNRFIDEDSKNRIIDSALNGDVKSVLRTGLKRANWDALN